VTALSEAIAALPGFLSELPQAGRSGAPAVEAALETLASIPAGMLEVLPSCLAVAPGFLPSGPPTMAALMPAIVASIPAVLLSLPANIAVAPAVIGQMMTGGSIAIPQADEPILLGIAGALLTNPEFLACVPPELASLFP
jgi:hypothetical protein